MKITKVKLSEHAIQSSFIKIIDLQIKVYPMLCLLFAIPNAAKRSMALAAMLKAEGLRSGVPDIMFPYKNNTFNGLALEFKAGKNKPTPEQLTWMNNLAHYGWKCVVVYDALEAWDIVKHYIGVQDEKY